MAGRDMACGWIGDQHRRAIRATHPEALGSPITDQAIRLRPGRGSGLARRQHNATVNLLGPVNAGAHTDVSRQRIGTPSMPEAGEEPMLKPLLHQGVGLEVVAAVATDPGPAVQTIEVTVRPIEGATRPHLGWNRCVHRVAMSRIIQKPAKDCSSGLV